MLSKYLLSECIDRWMDEWSFHEEHPGTSGLESSILGSTHSLAPAQKAEAQTASAWALLAVRGNH